MIEILKPIFTGPLTAYGEGLICDNESPSGPTRLGELLATPPILEEILSRQGRMLGTNDLRPVASAWMLKYAALLLPPVAAAATLLEHVFPVDSADVVLQLDDNGTPQAVRIPHLGENMSAQDTATRYTALLDRHLTPLIDNLSLVSRLPTKILWGNVSRRLDAILTQAATLAITPAMAAVIAQDRDHLLLQPVWTRGRRNPLFGRQRTELVQRVGGRARILLHRQCCLQYLLPGEDYCGACPLSPRFHHSGDSSTSPAEKSRNAPPVNRHAPE